MKHDVLVAGIGNIFFGDDGFGVEVVRRLSQRPLPDGVRVVDFGIRGLHLAFELLTPPTLLILVDAAAYGGRPGTLYLIEPATYLETGRDAAADPHGMDLGEVFRAVSEMGGQVPLTRIVGCEPQRVGEGSGLSAPVQQAISPAVEMIVGLVEREVMSDAKA